MQFVELTYFLPHSFSSCNLQIGSLTYLCFGRCVIAAITTARCVIAADEIRLMHGCELCSGPFETAGDLLAWHARNATATIRQAHGGYNGTVGTWDDMFNPFHNAGDDYFLINGTLNNSWTGLDRDVCIWNWGASDATRGRQGLEFFAARGHQQIFCGYYDSHDGAKSAQRELAIANGVKGVQGFMYTTWRNDYTQMCKYAETIQKGYASGGENDSSG
jgi:hypothetical protein